MNRFYVPIIFFFLLSITCSKEKDEITYKKELKTPTEKFSYAMGLDGGNYIKNYKDEIDIPSFIQGMQDALNDSTYLLTEEEVDKIKREIVNKVREKRKREILEEGEKFLAENKNKDGVITTASGLQYIILKEGDGSIPQETDCVKVHYHGTLIDGTEFDSSYKRGEPTAFRLDQVIPGWTEAVQLMNVGSKFMVYIPSELAYGERGAGNVIPPNSTLIFEIELLEILKKDN